MQGLFRRHYEILIGAGIGFLVSGIITSKMGYCGSTSCFSIHASDAPLTQFVGGLFGAVGLVLFVTGASLRPKTRQHPSLQLTRREKIGAVLFLALVVAFLLFLLPFQIPFQPLP